MVVDLESLRQGLQASAGLGRTLWMRTDSAVHAFELAALWSPIARSSVASLLQRPRPGDTGKVFRRWQGLGFQERWEEQKFPVLQAYISVISPHYTIYFKRRTSYLIIPLYRTLGRFLTSTWRALWAGSRYSSSANPQCAEKR